MELVNEFIIVPGCRVTVKAENNIVAIRSVFKYDFSLSLTVKTLPDYMITLKYIFSCNDAIGKRNANNLIYAIPYEVLTNKKSENRHHVIKHEKTGLHGVEVETTERW